MTFLLGAICVLLVAFLAYRERQWLSLEKRFRDEMTSEREIWARERRDLLNRIQVPEAAPYLSEDEQGPSDDDLPLPPTQTLTEDEMEAAREALAEVGYAEGPVG